MAAIHIKSDSRRKHEAYTLQSFVKDTFHATAQQRDAAETIAAKSREQYRAMVKEERCSRE